MLHTNVVQTFWQVKPKLNKGLALFKYLPRFKTAWCDNVNRTFSEKSFTCILDLKGHIAYQHINAVRLTYFHYKITTPPPPPPPPPTTTTTTTSILGFTLTGLKKCLVE